MRQIKIGDKWTLDNYGLLLAPNPTIDIASPKVETTPISGGDGSLDLTEALTGEVNYNDRNINFGLVFIGNPSDWPSKYQELVANVHGRRLDLIMPQYPGYCFNGRVSVGALNVENDEGSALVQLTASADPYRLKRQLTTVTATVPVSGSLTLNLVNERMTTLPTFTINASSQIAIGSNSYSHVAGTFTIANVFLVQGDNRITIKATAGTKVTITYQEGAL